MRRLAIIIYEVGEGDVITLYMKKVDVIALLMPHDAAMSVAIILAV